MSPYSTKDAEKERATEQRQPKGTISNPRLAQRLLPWLDGIDSSGDPLTQVRADLYLLSRSRRRTAIGDRNR